VDDPPPRLLETVLRGTPFGSRLGEGCAPQVRGAARSQAVPPRTGLPLLHHLCWRYANGHVVEPRSPPPFPPPHPLPNDGPGDRLLRHLARLSVVACDGLVCVPNPLPLPQSRWPVDRAAAAAASPSVGLPALAAAAVAGSAASRNPAALPESGAALADAAAVADGVDHIAAAPVVGAPLDRLTLKGPAAVSYRLPPPPPCPPVRPCPSPYCRSCQLLAIGRALARLSPPPPAPPHP